MKTAMMAALTVIGRESVEYQAPQGKTAAAAREAADTRFDENNTTMKVSRALRLASGDRTTTQPAQVATPLPPSLNFKNSGYSCFDKW